MDAIQRKFKVIISNKLNKILFKNYISLGIRIPITALFYLHKIMFSERENALLNRNNS